MAAPLASSALSVKITTPDFGSADSTITALMKGVYDIISQKKIGGKCVGVMQVNIDSSPPQFFVAISGYSQTVAGEDPKGWAKAHMATMGKDVNSIFDSLIAAKQIPAGSKVVLCPFDTQRTFYGPIDAKTSWSALRAQITADQLDSIVDVYRQRLANVVRDLRLGPYKTFIDNKDDVGLAARISNYLDSTVWSGRISSDKDKEGIVRWLLGMAKDEAVEKQQLDGLVSSLKDARTMLESNSGLIDQLAAQQSLDRGAVHVQLTNAAAQGANMFQTKCKELELPKLEAKHATLLNDNARATFYSLGGFLNTLGAAYGIHSDPRTTKILDILSQCAEDNACIELIQQLKSLPRPKVIEITWFSTHRPNAGSDILHKPLCEFCEVRFVERLTDLLCNHAWAMSAVSAFSNGAPSPLGRLYRHPLESVFGFFSLQELVTRSRVSRDWMAAALRMKPLGISLQLGSRAIAGQLCVSPLSKHIGTLSAHESIVPTSWHSEAGKFSVVNLADLALRAIHLTDLRVELSEGADAIPSIQWPSKLVRLQLRFHGTVDQWNSVLNSFNVMHNLSALRMCIHVRNFRTPRQLDFTPLQSIKILRELGIEWHIASADAQLTHAQLDQIRELPELDRISLPLLSSENLLYLLRSPHSLRWPEVPGYCNVEEISEALATLPLTRLKATPTRSFQFLEPLVNTLQQFTLNVYESTPTSADVEGALCRCVHLTFLHLQVTRVCSLSSAQLTTILRTTPQLRELELYIMQGLDSLQFLAADGVPQLTGLKLEHIEQMDLDEFDHIRAQTHLRSLTVQGVFNSPMDQMALSQLKRPSWCPALTHSDCDNLHIPPSEDEDDRDGPFDGDGEDEDGDYDGRD